MSHLIKILLMAIPLTGCMSAYIQSIGGDTSHVLERIYVSDWATVWQATLDSLKHMEIELSSQDSGYIRTKWVDNTSEKNFSDSFSQADDTLNSKYRFQINLGKTYKTGRVLTKVTILKEQVVQKDPLEDWHSVPTDSIDEKTLLYRIGRLILLNSQVKKPVPKT